jgi:hypothetical protein
MQRSENIQVDGATAAIVSISMAVGELRIGGGASALLDADFTYDEELQPLIDKRREGDLARIDIQQDSGNKGRSTRNEWDIRLNDAVPLDLRVGMAAAQGAFNLDGLRLSRLDVDTAAGDASISAGGNQPDLSEVIIDTASGDVALGLTGSYPQASRVAVHTAAGSVDLDLNGTWQRDLNVSLDTVAGSVQVNVPSSVGVAVQSSSMVGSVSLDGDFRRNAEGSVNRAYDQAPVTLRLTVSTISGSVTVREMG